MRPSLLADLTAAVGAAFAAEGLDPALGRVQVSDRPDLAQFQSNGALAAAKAAKANPRALAEKIAARLAADARFAKVEIAGPGFLNLDLADGVLDAALAAPDAVFAPAPAADRGRVVVDFGGPNVAKAMHVGHLRSSIIGDALQRHLKFAGFAAVGDVHLGDWGKPMGMLIAEMLLQRADTDEEAQQALTLIGAHGRQPKAPTLHVMSPSGVTLDGLNMLYPAVSAATKEDPDFDALARRATERLQARAEPFVRYWKELVQVSIEGMKREFASLGVSFDLWKGESDVDHLIPQMLDDLKARGIAELDDGALIV
ncbi:MAG: arginine--tRNA ligase, partial [Alphaproteobacteria bacterium]|nr:arginine--tRNA ligase [Alphaproteobacteria bacterium]